KLSTNITIMSIQTTTVITSTYLVSCSHETTSRQTVRRLLAWKSNSSFMPSFLRQFGYLPASFHPSRISCCVVFLHHAAKSLQFINHIYCILFLLQMFLIVRFPII